MIVLSTFGGRGEEGGVVGRALASHQWENWVQIPASMPNVGEVCCWSSPLLREVFLWVVYVQFSPLLKNQHFQIPIRSEMHGHIQMSS